jgi:hypothetical protein
MDASSSVSVIASAFFNLVLLAYSTPRVSITLNDAETLRSGQRNATEVPGTFLHK